MIVLTKSAKQGDRIWIIVLGEDVASGHKVAISSIKSGSPIVKYGHVIGSAIRDINPGEWVHEHNMISRLGTGQEEQPQWKEPVARCIQNPLTSKTFMGYRRNWGRAGVRNDIWIIPTVGCVNGELRFLMSEYRKQSWIDAVRILEHPYGCSQLGYDHEMTLDILSGLAANPNAAGVLIVGLGCENLQAAAFFERIQRKRGHRNVGCVILQTDSNSEIPKILDKISEEAPRQREAFPLSGLCVGVKCGGSDGYSGLTANPLLGRFSDFLISCGGTILATEIPEMFGAESVIAERAVDRSVYDEFIAMDRWFRDYYARYGQPIYENPSPGNREGGITTLEEKSLGAIEKTGNAPVTHVLRYGEPVRDGGGVQITFSPGNDLISCTALAGSGAQIILFTTGRGTPHASVTPTVKVSTNTQLAERHPDWIDFDAGSLLAGESWEKATTRFFDYVMRVANGEKTAHEKKGFGEIAIFKDGVTL